MDVIDGFHRDSFTVSGPTELAGTVQGSVSVSPGTTFTVSGTLQGALHVAPHAEAVVSASGRIQGALDISAGGVADVYGYVAGTVVNAGTLIQRNGSTHAFLLFGDGVVNKEPHATIVQPRMESDGSFHYDA